MGDLTLLRNLQSSSVSSITNGSWILKNSVRDGLNFLEGILFDKNSVATHRVPTNREREPGSDCRGAG